MSENFIAFLTTLALALAVPAVLLALATFVGPKARTYKASRFVPYESGVASTIGTARERFSIKFYLVAILFIVFDVEAVFLFPWAVNFRELGMLGLVEMFVFIGVLLAGFVYILKKGALKWD